MENYPFLLVNASVLPPVFSSVIEAKALLASGRAKNASEAARLAGISRSAFYKYADKVFQYNGYNQGKTITVSALLSDRVGVLSALVSELSKIGANILTMNQDIPADGSATVSISIRCDHMEISLNEMLDQLKQIDGVLSVKYSTI